MAVTTITSTTTPVATGTTTKNSGVSSSTTVAKSTVATSSTTATTTTASTTARAYVSSATASTTASTTYASNSSSTSKVIYISRGSDSITSEDNQTSTGSIILVKKKTGSTTPASSTTPTSSTTPVSSTTPERDTMPTVDMIPKSNTTATNNTDSNSGVSDERKEDDNRELEITWDGSLIDGLKTVNFNDMLYNLSKILDEGICFGVEYNLGEVSYNMGIGATRISYSASVEFSEEDPNAFMEVALGLKEGFINLEQVIKDNNIGVNAETIARFSGKGFEIYDDMSVHSVIHEGNISIDLNDTALSLGVVDITVSVSNAIDDYASVTNEISFTGNIYWNSGLPETEDDVVNKEEPKERELEWYEKVGILLDELGEDIETEWNNIEKTTGIVVDSVSEFVTEHQEEITITAATATAIIALASGNPGVFLFAI